MPRVMADGRVAVIRAEDFYLPPPARRADAWRRMPAAERAITWYENKQQRRLPRPTTTLKGQDRLARIDAGRWVADCPCGSAQVVSPTDPRMFCVDCLTGWWPLLFPTNTVAAEQAVAHLPAHRRFWWQDDDTPAQTKRELTGKQLADRAARAFGPPETDDGQGA